MGEAPIPKDEASRLCALADVRILDTAPEAAFDDLARIASELCGAPVALVSFVDADRQWFKARVNFVEIQTSRNDSFCAHALEVEDALVIRDTHDDPRFVGNPLVTSKPNFRFYAGVPLRVDGGSALGTLCVLDYVPRDLAPEQLAGLRALAGHIARELRVRRELDAARVAAAESPLVPGDVLDERWTIVRPLGKGSVGAVFEARGPKGERAAVKLLMHQWISRDEVLERFTREARVLLRLKNPHVCGLIDVGNLKNARGGLPYLVLEYLEGDDLDRRLEEEQRIDWRRASRWIADACSGVAAAHELGIIHRDLKPSNIFLAKEADGEIVKVLDFGVAKSVSAETESSEITDTAAVGTPRYMSPEQMLGSRDVGPTSDVWAMGAVLYEMVTGKAAFGGSTQMATCAAVLLVAPPTMRAHVPDVPAVLEEVVRKCLAREAGARYATMNELRLALLSSLST